MKLGHFPLRPLGFTLLEMLLVMTLLAFLMVSGTLVTNSVQRASQISRDITILADELSKASLEAVRINRPIHFRFYRFTDPVVDSKPVVQGFQTLTLDADSKRYVQLDKIRRFTEGVAILDDTTASTILSLPEITPVTGSGPGKVTDPELRTIAPYTYYQFEFRPDGSTNLPKDRAWGIVLAFHAESVATGGMPPGYRALSVNPFTGAVRRY